MKFPVKIAKLHASYFPGGCGNLGDVLDPASRHLGMTMFLTENGLFVSYKNTFFVVPLANVVGMTLTSDPFAAQTETPSASSKVITPKAG